VPPLYRAAGPVMVALRTFRCSIVWIVVVVLVLGFQERLSSCESVPAQRPSFDSAPSSELAQGLRRGRNEAVMHSTRATTVPIPQGTLPARLHSLFLSCVLALKVACWLRAILRKF